MEPMSGIGMVAAGEFKVHVGIIAFWIVAFGYIQHLSHRDFCAGK
jgi:hypothetical protein